MAKVKFDKTYAEMLESQFKEVQFLQQALEDLKKEAQVVKWLYGDEIEARKFDDMDWEVYASFIDHEWVKLDPEDKKAELDYIEAMRNRTDAGRVAFSRFLKLYEDFKREEDTK